MGPWASYDNIQRMPERSQPYDLWAVLSPSLIVLSSSSVCVISPSSILHFCLKKDCKVCFFKTVLSRYPFFTYKGIFCDFCSGFKGLKKVTSIRSTVLIHGRLNARKPT